MSENHDNPETELATPPGLSETPAGTRGEEERKFPFEGAKAEEMFPKDASVFAGSQEYDDADFAEPEQNESVKSPPQSVAIASTDALTSSRGNISTKVQDHPPLQLQTEPGLTAKGMPRLPKGRFADRELSWLAFNQRVFEQAQDEQLKLLERAWFLTIYCSNLDEFYMVRVAGLKRRIAAGFATVSSSGLTPRQLEGEISRRSHEMTGNVYHYFQETIRPELDKAGLVITDWEALNDTQQNALHRYFRNQVFPILSPLAIDPAHPFPFISGLALNLAILVRNPSSGKDHFARLKVPAQLPRFVPLSEQGVENDPSERILSGEVVNFVPMEQIIAAHLDHLFPGMEIVESHPFRVTRNEDLEVEEDDAENILTAMESELAKRRFGPAVRLEVTEKMPAYILDFLTENLEIGASDVFRLAGPLDLRGLNDLHNLDIPELKYPPYVPVTPAGLAEKESAKSQDLFAAIREHDVLIHLPYDSFATSVQQFVVQAANDPNVLAIKQTLYRTSGDSPIVQALIDAARAGKQVVAIVEIKARFDEAANISWARKMERYGVHVVYGMVGLKTHCKLCLVVRQEPDGLKRYCHVGTGNYHPKTARGYEDLGLLTVNRDVAQDLTRLFNQLSGYAPRSTFHRLLVAPRSIRDGLLAGIEQEIANHQAGKPAWILFKANSIVDERMTDALYRASQAGVPVDVQVRGICSLKPGIPGLSENIRVVSILGRFLEHSRVYAFANDGNPQVWIGSADLMHRNLDRRVEALVRIINPEQVKYLIEVVRKGVSDLTSSWRLMPDQQWVRVTADDAGNRLEDIQETLMAQTSSRVVGRNCP
ncbi:RNA degradosome polyphosphate kinase [Mobiluncus mulieris]|uniref:Polyphosphate kinase n=1 Tax=Mobiluncus mulieris TaxID=2052 RepID=A0A7Y0UUK4_9ACTO|nr:RNA degradosome polyphosphate kinase [Mobiluncus mulieris]NMX04010.1 RNA degradosome polyphosphate kinase [Mobiluncus mulieris]NMX11957.1 RNA degradosome polyphosphate kinase [Mobiluncus mulieris]